jgi:hypothetical protein
LLPPTSNAAILATASSVTLIMDNQKKGKVARSFTRKRCTAIFV